MVQQVQRPRGNIFPGPHAVRPEKPTDTFFWGGLAEGLLSRNACCS
jgi:hypothetical protein